MNKIGGNMENDLLQKIIKILDDKKAVDIKYMEIKDVTTIADYFVITNGTSNTHIKALADNVEYELKKDGIYPNKIEGYESGTWILMDYGDVIIHIFTESERANYQIEELWQEMKQKLD